MTTRLGLKAHQFGHAFSRSHSAGVTPRGHSTPPPSSEGECGGKIIIPKCVQVQEAAAPFFWQGLGGGVGVSEMFFKFHPRKSILFEWQKKHLVEYAVSSYPQKSTLPAWADPLSADPQSIYLHGSANS